MGWRPSRYGHHWVPNSVGTTRARSHSGLWLPGGAGRTGIIGAASGGGGGGTLNPGWPFPPSSTAYNMTCDRDNFRAFFRIVCPKAGILDRIYLHLKCGSNGSAIGNGYGGGTTGELSAQICSADGTNGGPGTVLHTDTPFEPGWYAVRAGELGRQNQNSVWIDAGGISVDEDEEICIVWWNSDPNPETNYFSINALHDDTGPHYAVADNNRDMDYTRPDGGPGISGFDPRTNSGWSTNSGSTYSIPAANVNTEAADGQWNPAYGLLYDGDTFCLGQPMYYPGGNASSAEVQTLKFCGTHDFTHLESYSVNGGSTSNVVIKKNGVIHQTVTGHAATAATLVRTALSSTLSVINTDVVTIEFNASGRGMGSLTPDALWGNTIFDRDTGRSCYLASDPKDSAPIILTPIPSAWKLNYA